MSTFAKFNRVALLAPFLLVACVDIDVTPYRRAYELYCREAATISFDQLTTDGTCNGLPGLHAVAASSDAMFRNNAAFVVQSAIDLLQVDVDKPAPGTGETAAMVAIAADNRPMARELVLRSDPRRIDARGRNLLYVLAESKFTNYDDLLLAWPGLFELLTERHGERPGALEAARTKRNLPFLWGAVALTHRAEVMRGLDVSYFFHDEAERDLSYLDTLGPEYRRSFTGTVDGAFVTEYSLLHYAAEHNLAGLVKFLLARGLDPSAVSTRGSPLALALTNASRELNSANRAGFEATVRLLMADPRAHKAADVPAALMAAGHLDGLNQVLGEGLPLGSYEYMQLGGPANNSPFQTALLGCYPRPNHCDKDAIRANLPAGLTAPPNQAGQNAAHTFYALVPFDDYHDLAGGTFSEGFRWFTLKAAALGLLDQDDILRMRPVHHWLSSPARRAGRQRFEEMTRLGLLLLKTKEVTTLTVNNDSVLSLAALSGNPNLVNVLLEGRPELRALIDLPNLLGKSPRRLTHESTDKEMQHVFDRYR